MYNDTIKVANKIITADDLAEIFALMNEKLQGFRKIHAQEEMQNKMLEYSYQRWSFRDNGSSISFTVNFYDDTTIKFDNYENFIMVFNNRLDEIKDIYMRFSLSYGVRDEFRNEYYNQHIIMNIYEHKMDIDISLKSDDKKIDDVYELIKTKVLSAPPKYDDVIKNKSSINFKVGFGIGMIPGLIIPTLLLLSSTVRSVFATTYVVFPIAVLVIAMFIGFMIADSKLGKLYKKIQPEQKYAGYDSSKGKSIYKDDIDKFTSTSEILIGKNIDNLKCRSEIIEIRDKYSKYLLPEFGIMLLLSIVVLFLG
jgi:hypothetical protein